MLRLKMLYRAAFAVILLFVLTNHSRAGLRENVGTTAFNFIKIGVGARAVGMGGAFSAIVDDATASYWNPAGLSQIEKIQLSAMHIEWFQGIRYEFIGYAHTLEDFGTFGIGGSLLTSGKMLKTVANPAGQYDEIGDFAATDIVGVVSYAKSVKQELNLDADLSLGANLKILHQRIDTRSVWGVAIDIGALYKFAVQIDKKDYPVNLGIVLQNIGPKLKFNDKAYTLPFKIGLGVATKLLEDDITIALNINIPNDSRINMRVGGEYWVTDDFTIRAGYKTGSELGTLSGLCTGMGAKFESLELDYAFVPYGILGLTHRFSIMREF